MNGKLLKLRAEDVEDVQVISAVLQDSIVPLCDMVFQTESTSFVIVAQRMRREISGATERICCALTIKGVVAVQTRSINLQQTERMLDLLAIVMEPSQQYLSLIFAGDARIRLDVKDWAAIAEDFGEPWPAQCTPCHDEAIARNP